MKLAQIQYALAVAETGSFSRAAKKLFTSQSNVSFSIASLEKKLDYEIFKRTNKGVDLTHEGQEFLKHAKIICEKFDDISKISHNHSYREFTIGCMLNHTVVSQAFAKFCNKYKATDKINFNLRHKSSHDIIEHIYHNEIDFGVLVLDEEYLNTNLDVLGNKGLLFKTLVTCRLNVILRKEHPLLQEESFYFTKLRNYPCVNYNFSTKKNFSFSREFDQLLSTGYINIDKMINVDDKEACMYITLQTDAFSIGPNLHPLDQSVNQVKAIPLPKTSTALVIVAKENVMESEESALFTSLLLDEVALLRK